MARHVAGSSGPITKLEDFQQYPAKVAGWRLGEAGDFGVPILVDLQLSAEEADILTVRFGIKLGQQKNGNVAALRRFLNAVAGRPERDAIAWFDDETGEFQLADGTVEQLRPGMYVRLRGKHEPSTSDPSKVYYNVVEYAPARSEAAPAPAQPTPAVFPAPEAMPARPAPDATDPSEVPW